MVHGHRGVYGQNVLHLVIMEYKLESEHVVTQNLNTMALPA